MINTNVLIQSILSKPEHNWDFNKLMRNTDLDLKFYKTFRNHVNQCILKHLLIFKKDLDLEFFSEFHNEFYLILNIDIGLIPKTRYIFEIMEVFNDCSWDYYGIVNYNLNKGNVTQKVIRLFCDKDLPWEKFNKKTIIDFDEQLVLDFPEKQWDWRNKNLSRHVSFSTIVKCKNVNECYYRFLSSHPGVDIDFIRKNKGTEFWKWNYKKLYNSGHFEIYYENLTTDEREYYDYVSNIIRKYVIEWLYKPGNPGYQRLFEQNKMLFQKSNN